MESGGLRPTPGRAGVGGELVAAGPARRRPACVSPPVCELAGVGHTGALCRQRLRDAGGAPRRPPGERHGGASSRGERAEPGHPPRCAVRRPARSPWPARWPCRHGRRRSTPATCWRLWSTGWPRRTPQWGGRSPGWRSGSTLPPEVAAGRLRAEGLDPDTHREWHGISAFVMPSVAWSLYAFLRTPDDYWATVCTAIAVGGDTDTMAAMAGAMAGARVGVAGLPPRRCRATHRPWRVEAPAELENARRETAPAPLVTRSVPPSLSLSPPAFRTTRRAATLLTRGRHAPRKDLPGRRRDRRQHPADPPQPAGAGTARPHRGQARGLQPVRFGEGPHRRRDDQRRCGEGAATSRDDHRRADLGKHRDRSGLRRGGARLSAASSRCPRR